MTRWFALCALLFLCSACSDNQTPVAGEEAMDPPSTTDQSGAVKSGAQNEQLVDLTSDNAASLADQFCANQKSLRLFSHSMLGVFSVMSTHPLPNSCGGEVAYVKDGGTFQITATDYCDRGTGMDLVVNANIGGAVESGANFTSDISTFTVTGDGVDLSASGHTWAGRYPDMFFTMQLTDRLRGTQLTLEEISIKKGELDLGFITFADLGRFEFRVITHFNFELTVGQIFFYGDQGEIIVMTAENGAITVVYKKDKLDPGELLDSQCSL